MLWTRPMDENFEMLLGMMKGMKAGREEMKAGQEEMKAGLEKKMEAGQERLEQVQEEMKDLIRAGKEEMRAHVESQIWLQQLMQFYRSELKTRRQQSGENLQVLLADVERLISLAYAECPLDVRESLAIQFFVDTIRDEETQLSTRVMDLRI
ncbi:hypothetical protein AVEN_120228-1 [Araneus ventricosus]|uniref:Uncharacterized protein n=1 Tax=Araneus ventricosus TaxID=182803 RepID=A0A4Y2TGF0_ARAVE|nr:hypothetical protein AVEN_120228-1 [Araneus ventricosus]